MPDRIVVECSACHGKLAVPGTAAGKKIRCPKCQEVVSVPAAVVAPAPRSEAPRPAKARSISAEPKRATRAEPPAPRTKPKKAKPKPADEESWEDDNLSSYDNGDDQWDSYGSESPPKALPPRAKQKAGSTRSSGRGESSGITASGSSEGTSGSVLTGILMMVGAAAWLFGGLAFNVFFPYPIVLFVLGLITMFKGMFGSD